MSLVRVLLVFGLITAFGLVACGARAPECRTRHTSAEPQVILDIMNIGDQHPEGTPRQGRSYPGFPGREGCS